MEINNLTLETLMIMFLIARVAAVVVIAGYIIPKQLAEVLRPKNWLTPLRWQLLLLVALILLTAIPGIFYQYYRIYEEQSESLRVLATICAALGDIIIAYLLVLIYNFRRKDG